MAELPDFWRIETVHPLIVHFPVALLPIAAFFTAFAHFTTNRALARTFRIPTLALLFIGTATAWLAVWTGHLADGVVSRQICDPTVLKDHENNSIVAAILFTVGFVLESVRGLPGGALRRGSGLGLLSLLVLLTGTAWLAYTGHLGATLVYQQAAGVYTPSSTCVEFSP